ncbi:MAG: GAF domain-containing protein, partial [Chloroflexota bacterium]
MPSSIGSQSSTASDAGLVRKINSDVLEMRESGGPLERARKGSIWAIADGIGSDHRAREAASLAAQTVVETYWNSAIPEVDARLQAAVERANAVLLAERGAGEERFGATILAAVLIENRLHVVHAGRSRAYILRHGALQPLTSDHTWVEQEVRAGRLSRDEAATHPRRNALTRALGIHETVEVDQVEETVRPGDVVLLCSDGVHRQIGEVEIAAILQHDGAAAAQGLIEEAGRQGGRDNATAVTVALEEPAARTTGVADRILQLSRLGTELAGSLDLDATLQSVLAHLLRLSGGERAAILLRDPDGKLSPYLSHNLDAGRDLPDPSRTVVDQSLRDQRPVLVRNALDTTRFGAAESIVAASLQSILSVPLLIRQETIGALYVDSASGEPMTIDDTDLELLVSFAGHAAAAIQNARLHSEVLERTREVELASTRQDALIRSLSSGLIALDNQGIVAEWNPAAEMILGVTAGEAVGSRLPDVLPPQVARWLMDLGRQAEAENQTIFAGDELETAIAGRPRVILAGRVARIRDHAGHVTGTVFVIIDRTDLVTMEEARQAEIDERERLRNLFSRYLAPSLVERLLTSPDAVQLGGTRKDVTILFADIRGFTGFSERSVPEDVVETLNQYLALATEAIFDQLGTLDKFLGDGIM